MAEPNLIELASEIADYMVINEFNALDSITYECENGDIRYIDVVQETFNDRYIFVLDLLEDSLNKWLLFLDTKITAWRMLWLIIIKINT